MRKTLFLLTVLLNFMFSQAQLVPDGMVLAKGNISSESETDVAKESSVEPSVETSGTSLNWNADTKSFADSVSIYQRDYLYNIKKRDSFYRAALISNWSGFAVSLAGLGLLGAGMTGHGSGYSYAGSAVLAVGLVGLGLSIGFDVASNAYSVRAGFFNQKKIDYQRRHSVLESGDN